jgi:hypothetical protein
MPANPPAIQELETLKARHKKLDRQKTTAEANCKTAEEQLQKLKDEARAKYGTDNIAELKAMLEQRKAENDRKRLEYQKHLDEIETKLAAIETRDQTTDPQG